MGKSTRLGRMITYECPNCKLRLKEPKDAEVWCDCRPRIKMKMVKVKSIRITEGHLLEELIWCYSVQYNKPLVHNMAKRLKEIMLEKNG